MLSDYKSFLNEIHRRDSASKIDLVTREWNIYFFLRWEAIEDRRMCVSQWTTDDGMFKCELVCEFFYTLRNKYIINMFCFKFRPGVYCLYCKPVELFACRCNWYPPSLTATYIKRWDRLQSISARVCQQSTSVFYWTADRIEILLKVNVDI